MKEGNQNVAASQHINKKRPWFVGYTLDCPRNTLDYTLCVASSALEFIYQQNISLHLLPSHVNSTFIAVYKTPSHYFLNRFFHSFFISPSFNCPFQA